MQMLTRDMVLEGPPLAVRLWATDMAERFTAVTGKEVETWQSLVGGSPGHYSWSMRVEGAAELLALSQQVMADEGYVHAIETGRAFFDGPAVDTLYQPLSAMPDAGTRPGNTLFVTVATARAGMLGDAASWAVEVAQHVESLTERPMIVVAPTVGRFSELVWLTAARDAAEADQNIARTNSDDGYRKMVARGGELFVDGSARQEMLVRVA